MCVLYPLLALPLVKLRRSFPPPSISNWGQATYVPPRSQIYICIYICVGFTMLCMAQPLIIPL
nr:hypothetical protein Q903MT_gene3171 [Picea sitchensis]